jgi:hypothetical protein
VIGAAETDAKGTFALSIKGDQTVLLFFDLVKKYPRIKNRLYLQRTCKKGYPDGCYKRWNDRR